MAARAGELRARVLWGYGFKVLCGYWLCQWLLAIDDWLLAMAIGHWLWLLVIDIYTKKCGYGYNPFWLSPIVHGYWCWLLIFTLGVLLVWL